MPAAPPTRRLPPPALRRAAGGALRHPAAYLDRALAPRPYLHPVTTLSGTPVTELAPDDHPHHLGAGVAVPDVAGRNFWGGRTFVRDQGPTELDNHGVQHHRGFKLCDPDGFVEDIDWTADGEVLLRERRTVAAVELSTSAWALDFTFSLTNATGGELSLGSPATNGRPGAAYGGFFWRAPKADAPPRVFTPEAEGEEAAHAARADWLALAGDGWTLVFAGATAQTRRDPWFVRAAAYPGVGSSLAARDRVPIAPRRRARTPRRHRRRRRHPGPGRGGDLDPQGGDGVRAGVAGACDLGDLGDGTYRNPVLAADWSDPDVLRVGDDFYLTASSFGRSPGLPLLHSGDLVNWTLIGHALDRLEPAEAFAVPRHDCGVWAPSLRHHDGRYWIFWGDPDHGVYQINAPRIRGPWTRPHLLKPGKGLIDPCPLWDEESGAAYLVHAWAKSRSGVKNLITGHRMTPDGRELLDEGRVLIDGDRLPGWFTIEGPKLYRHDGWFWIFAPAGGVATGWQGAFRSRAFHGPYEERVVLQQGGTDVNGPHQGGWVRTAAGEDWFLHFQQRGAYGRVVHLQPMRWGADGWPVLGDDGAPVDVHRKPDLPPQPPSAPATNDDFPGGRHGPQWQWAANPRTGWTTSHAGDGLRLTCRTHHARRRPARPAAHAHPAAAPAAVFRRRRAASGRRSAARRGRVGGARRRVRVGGSGAGRGRGGPPGAPVRRSGRGGRAGRRAAAPGTARHARQRVEITEGARCRFHADTGDGYRPTGAPEFTATPWRWVGALLGLFAAAPAGEEPTGTALFTQFRITHRTLTTPREESRR